MFETVDNETDALPVEGETEDNSTQNLIIIGVAATVIGVVVTAGVIAFRSKLAKLRQDVEEAVVHDITSFNAETPNQK